jgi:hypothetical protein
VILDEHVDFRRQARRAVWETLLAATTGLLLQCVFGEVPVDTASEGVLAQAYEGLEIAYLIDDSPERFRQRAYDYVHDLAARMLWRWDADDAIIAEMKERA